MFSVLWEEVSSGAPVSPSWTGLEFLIDMVHKTVYQRGSCRDCLSDFSRSLSFYICEGYLYVCVYSLSVFDMKVLL